MSDTRNLETMATLASIEVTTGTPEPPRPEPTVVKATPLPTDVQLAQLFQRLRTLERVVAGLQAQLDAREGDGR